MLLKQDRLSLLEKQLERIDDQELTALFLGSARRDTNTERKKVLDEIGAALSVHGKLQFILFIDFLSVYDDYSNKVLRRWIRLSNATSKC